MPYFGRENIQQEAVLYARGEDPSEIVSGLPPLQKDIAYDQRSGIPDHRRYYVDLPEEYQMAAILMGASDSVYKKITFLLLDEILF
jgi:hypothetical protein